jgi:Transposase DNA-binding
MMILSLGCGTNKEFVEAEFQELDLNDKRLNKRAKTILGTLGEKLSSCIRRIFIDPKEARQAYDLF